MDGQRQWLEADVGVTLRAADLDGQHRARRAELCIQPGLGDLGVQAATYREARE